jgi:PKD repeat protein
MRSFHRNLCFTAALSLVGAACGGDNGPSNTPPTANFAAPTCVLLACTFTDASTDSDGSIASRSWTFENGTPATSTEATQAVTFPAGTHTVTLTVTDNEGATDDFSSDVTVSGTPGNQAPVAAFTVQCSSLECTFTNASTDADGTVESYLWDFGEPGSPDNTSTEASPTHTYSFTELTEVTVTLTVTDDDGDTGTTTETFTVSPAAGLECEDGTPDCELPIEQDATVTATLTSSDCELSGNTFKVLITPPGGGTPVEETLFTDGCNTPVGTSFQLQSNAVFAAGTIITAQLISGGQTLELPPALRVQAGSAFPTWTLEFDDGAIGPDTDPNEPDFNDLVITIEATPQ